MSVWWYIKHKILRFKYFEFENIKKKDQKKAYMQKNLYDHKGNIAEYTKKMNKLHRNFKYAFLVPLIGLAKRLVGKHVKEHTPSELQFKNLLIFENVIEKSLEDWADKYLCLGTLNKKEHRKKVAWFLKKNVSVRLVRDLKDLLRVYVRHDTAYLELLNFLMFNMAVEMGRAHGSKPGHLLYHQLKIDMPEYFIVLRAADELKVHNLEKLRFKVEDKKSG